MVLIRFHNFSWIVAQNAAKYDKSIIKFVLRYVHLFFREKSRNIAKKSHNIALYTNSITFKYYFDAHPSPAHNIED